jgi:4-hydroxy-3-polyprenylbenzoate decarboxylase
MKLDELKDYIKIIDTPLDINLEIPHLAYIEAKKKNPKILMFTNPKEGDKKFDIPVVMNIFANFEVIEKIFGKNLEKIADEIEELIKMKPPKTLSDKLKTFGKLFALKNTIPKTVKNAECQYYVKEGEAVNLNDLPILMPKASDIRVCANSAGSTPNASSPNSSKKALRVSVTS